MLDAVARAYRGRGENHEAEPLLEPALALGSSANDAEPGSTQATRVALAEVAAEFGKFDRAQSLCLEALGAFERQPDPDTATRSRALFTLASIATQRRDYAEAERRA